MKQIALFIGIFFCICLFSHAFAESETGIIVSEIHPTAEYIELENISDTNISLQGWKWSEETGSGVEKFYDLSGETLGSGKFFVREISRKINNSGDILRLYSPNGTEINLVESIEIPAEKNDGKSWQKISGVWQWEDPTKGLENTFINNSSHEEETPVPTPIQSSTPIPSLSPSPSPEQTPTSQELLLEKNYPEIQISELFPNPVGSDSEQEFFELYNPNDKKISLENWYIQDASGKKYFFPSEKFLNPGEYKIFLSSLTKISINNSDESLFLFSPTSTLLSKLQFSGSAPEGQSFISSGWTTSPTPNLENIFSPPPQKTLSSENSSLLFLEKYIPQALKRKITPELLITKVFANTSLKWKTDSVEVVCLKCNMDLYNIRLGTGKEIYRIPKNIYVESGETLYFIFEKNTKKKPEKISNGWKFFIPVSGLTTTDETLYIGDGRGKILDAVIWTNQNRYFSSSKENTMGNLIYTGAWKGRSIEWNAVNTKIFPRKSALTRKKENGKYLERNSKDDFYFSFQEENFFNIPKKSLQFSQIEIFPEQTVVSVQNVSNQKINISSVFLANKTSFLSFLSTQEKFLYPGESVQIFIPQKKGKRSDMVFSLRDQKNDVFDIFCLNTEKEGEKFLHTSRQKNIWKGKCFRFVNKGEKNKKKVFIRTNFKDISSSQSYEVKNREISQITKNSETIGNLGITKNSSKINSNESQINKEKQFASQTGRIQNAPWNFFPDGRQEEEIQNFRITKILPNPDGKDKNNEKIFLQNFSQKAGWIRDWKFITTTTSKNKTVTKTKNISPLFLEAGEKIILSARQIPTLKNSSASIELYDSYWISQQKISWKKARSGEYFGENAPRYIAKKKTSSSYKNNRRKNVKKNKNIQNFIQKVQLLKPEKNIIISGILIRKTAEYFVFEDSVSHQEIQIYVPEYLKIYSKNFSLGSIAMLEISTNFKTSKRTQQILSFLNPIDSHYFTGIFRENIKRENFLIFFSLVAGMTLIFLISVFFMIKNARIKKILLDIL